jgi:hypothetical protein
MPTIFEARHPGDQAEHDNAVRVESLAARLRQLRRDAARRGLLVRKASNNPNLDRYIIVERDTHMTKCSQNFEFPYSFSLNEAERYLAKRV